MNIGLLCSTQYFQFIWNMLRIDQKNQYLLSFIDIYPVELITIHRLQYHRTNYGFTKRFKSPNFELNDESGFDYLQNSLRVWKSEKKKQVEYSMFTFLLKWHLFGMQSSFYLFSASESDSFCRIFCHDSKCVYFLRDIGFG